MRLERKVHAPCNDDKTLETFIENQDGEMNSTKSTLLMEELYCIACAASVLIGYEIIRLICIPFTPLSIGTR